MWFEHKTSTWVIPNSTDLCALIENTDKPDFKSLYAKIDTLEKRWRIYDPEFNGYKVRARLLEFKNKNRS